MLIERIHSDRQDQYAVVRLQLKVTGRIQLANVIRKIRKISDVTKVAREEERHHDPKR